MGKKILRSSQSGKKPNEITVFWNVPTVQCADIYRRFLAPCWPPSSGETALQIGVQVFFF